MHTSREKQTRVLTENERAYLLHIWNKKFLKDHSKQPEKKSDMHALLNQNTNSWSHKTGHIPFTV